MGANTHIPSTVNHCLSTLAALLQTIQGKLSDLIGIHQSFIVAVICFGYLTLFAILVKGILKKQNIDIDAIASEGGH